MEVGQGPGGHRETSGTSFYLKEIQVSTEGRNDVHDLTAAVEVALSESCVKEGFIIVFAAGSTAGVTTLEFEPGLVSDLKKASERWAPSGIRYAHDERWRDGNGFSHIRSALVGTSFTVPVHNGGLLLGTWQQIVLVDFDNRARTRKVIIQVVGAK
jgi:secondary thiamine-phosphate synthase enzyme